MTTPNPDAGTATPPAGASGAPSAGTPPTEGAAPTGTPAGDAPVEYTFTAPDGETFDAAMVEKVATLAKELKLPQDAAQQLVLQQHALATASTKAITETVNGWKAELAADPVLGGDKLAENTAIVNKPIALGGQELVKLMEESGMIHHPVVFKWLYAIGKTLSEDRFVQAGAQPGAGGNTPTAKVLYPNNA